MKHLLPLLLLLLPGLCGAQKTIPFVAYWSVGDAYSFNITKIKQQWKNGEASGADTSSYVARFTVVDSADTYYRIRWDHETPVSGVHVPRDLQQDMRKYDLDAVIYRTDELGAFIEIENWEVIGYMMKEVFQFFLDEKMNEDPQRHAAMVKAMEPLLEAYSSKQGIEQLVFKEIQQLHSPFGAEYTVKKPVSYNDQFPNMFGGKPIKAKGTLRIGSVDVENSRCVMFNEVRLDPNGAKEALTDVFKRMAMDDKQVKKMFKNARLDIRDDNMLEYYYYPGIPIRLDLVREILVEIEGSNSRRIERTIIELVQ